MEKYHRPEKSKEAMQPFSMGDRVTINRDALRAGIGQKFDNENLIVAKVFGGGNYLICHEEDYINVINGVVEFENTQDNDPSGHDIMERLSILSFVTEVVTSRDIEPRTSN